MNSTTRTALRLLLATPIAVGAIAFGGATAHADGIPAGPGVIVAPPPSGDPTPHGPGEIALPEPKPDPKPQGPGDITNPEPKPDPDPHGPGDITNPDPKPDPKPHGPGDLAIPDPQDKPDDEPAEPGDAPKPGPKGGHQTTPVDDEPAVEVANKTGAIDVPSRIDAGAGSAVAVDDEQGLDLMWLLAGGGALTAAGSVLARQRLARRTR
ncbi:hypothetical protein [Nocardioides sp. LML1-1-1.1]|uniref:hypothetical protein n=1 Tax=Nocardioides sp. LML1-1-1.1 TaxID=3135248 RepID=UPI00341C030D